MINKKGFISVFIFLFLTSSIFALNERKLKLYNIGGQIGFSLLKAGIQGKIKSKKDFFKILIYGGISGYGFYKSKKMISDGKITSGILMANLSYSITENITTGKKPFHYFYYINGPIKIGVKNIFIKEKSKFIKLSISIRNLAQLLCSFIKYKDTKKINYETGILTFQISDPKYTPIGAGWIRGLYPFYLKGSGNWVYKHELIHIIQNYQLMSLSPEPYTKYGIELNCLNFFIFDVCSLPSKKNEWIEKEAYIFTNQNWYNKLFSKD